MDEIGYDAGRGSVEGGSKAAALRRKLMPLHLL